MTDDEYELRFEIPGKLVYELSRLGCHRPVVVWGGPECLTIDQDARRACQRLLNRLVELQRRARRNQVLARWYLRHSQKTSWRPPRLGGLSPMGMDEVIIGRRIVDQGG